MTGSRRSRPSTRSRPTVAPRSCGRAGRRQLADDSFSPTFLRSARLSRRAVTPPALLIWLSQPDCSGPIRPVWFIKSDGTPWRLVVHIEDMSLAFVAALNYPRELVHNEAFRKRRPPRELPHPRNWPRSWPRLCPTAAWNSPRRQRRQAQLPRRQQQNCPHPAGSRRSGRRARRAGTLRGLPACRLANWKV